MKAFSLLHFFLILESFIYKGSLHTYPQVYPKYIGGNNGATVTTCMDYNSNTLAIGGYSNNTDMVHILGSNFVNYFKYSDPTLLLWAKEI